MKSIGRSLKDYPQLPQPPAMYLESCSNHLIAEETNYDMMEMKKEYMDLLCKCNEEQLEVYNSVIKSVDNNEGSLFFVYGSGGCGKTYLWRTLICKLRSEGKIVLPVASSGIAATLLPGGRTAHSRFKIPIILDDYSLCGIAHNSESAELIKRTSLIIWDEAPMQHRYAFECLDRSLRDLMKSVDRKRFDMPFGGITVLLGGDFRQILPVIRYGSRADIVSASITRSRLWQFCKVFVLRKNMRLKRVGDDECIEVMRIFAKWVLDIGDGNIGIPDGIFSEVEEFDIAVPEDFCDLENCNSVENMIQSIYPNLQENFRNPDYLSERAILTPTNHTVDEVNGKIVEKIPGESKSYFSVDRADDFGCTESELNIAFPIEYLNSLIIPGVPHHELKLKVGVVVMLMRNLNQTIGLCNGTRMIVTKCLKHCVECEVICGTFAGSHHFIPRMECSPTDTKLPFKLIRKQMPLQICYAMTINKSQGQSLEKAGLYLPDSVFTHGQFYVAISRVTTPGGLKMFIDDENGESTSKTKNVVYKEVFYNVPSA